jgi:hypothetical protein
VYTFEKNSEQSNTLEQVIASELWKWQQLSDSERAGIISPKAGLAAAIEGYFCKVFCLKNSSHSSNWWCDGVEGLLISETASTAFVIVGAAYWGEVKTHQSQYYLAPFELEFFFKSLGDLDPDKVIVRFGVSDQFGEIKKIPYTGNIALVIRSRPTMNSAWAFAICLS